MMFPASTDMTQLKTVSLLSTFLLAGITSVSAHGYIVSWEIDGERKPGFQPSYPPQFGPTAERPTDNKDHGRSGGIFGRMTSAKV